MAKSAPATRISICMVDFQWCVKVVVIAGFCPTFPPLQSA
ncbi:hypothetical protein HBZS_114020 [Helicobacter bizzozeronii CCUG 35545]|nr:hypothetical protein HBZS_114020 [Helicobacter bizzozeronii CCUG 35545]